MAALTCRSCGAPLHTSFANLGMSPLANSYIAANDVQQMEKFYPLNAFVCDSCLLVQLGEFESPDHIFSDYLYFSSYSDSWLRHAERYTSAMIERFRLNEKSQVVEVASNDGYLLQYFKQQGIPVLGVEPAANVAEVARKKGIPTEVRFFGQQTGEDLHARGFAADLMTANNVIAHVPDVNDFVRGFRGLLKNTGTVTVEFPHLLRLIDENQFDTIYHEHFSYFSLLAIEHVFERNGMRVYDVEELPTHGGSLRIFAAHADGPHAVATERLLALRDAERRAGLATAGVYRDFAKKVVQTKCDVMTFFVEAKRKGKKVVGYGAPAKGNTLLNYCGIGEDFIEFTVDRSPHKQGMFLPGTHIPICSPDDIAEAKPDYLFILPWNLKDEIMEQMASIRTWGGKFVVPIPSLTILP